MFYKCPECEKIIDDYIEKCPYCGHSISSSDSISDDRLRNLAEMKQNEDNAELQKWAAAGKRSFNYHMTQLIIVIIAFFVILILLITA